MEAIIKENWICEESGRLYKMGMTVDVTRVVSVDDFYIILDSGKDMFDCDWIPKSICKIKT